MQLRHDGLKPLGPAQGVSPGEDREGEGHEGLPVQDETGGIGGVMGSCHVGRVF